jgi:hypothetical protein
MEANLMIDENTGCAVFAKECPTEASCDTVTLTIDDVVHERLTNYFYFLLSPTAANQNS